MIDATRRALTKLRAALGAVGGAHPVPGRELRSGSRRGAAISGVTIHESVCEKVEGVRGGIDPEDVLAKRGLSVHMTVQRPDDEVDGLGAAVRVTEHVPIERAAWHAGFWHNRRDVGLEVENRYRPRDGDDALERVGRPLEGVRDVIVGRWVWKRRKHKHRLYVVPAIAQLEATWAVVWSIAKRLELEPWFPAVTGEGFPWGRSKHHKARREGCLAICAHYRWAHADGLVPEHYCYLRSLGHDGLDAYRLTLEAASLGKRWTKAPIVAGGVRPPAIIETDQGVVP
jgi:hypothetical protein